jgi:uridine kinase
VGAKGIGKTNILKNVKKALTKEEIMIIHLEFNKEEIKQFKN